MSKVGARPRDEPDRSGLHPNSGAHWDAPHTAVLLQHAAQAADLRPVQTQTATDVHVRPLATPRSEQAARWWTAHQPIAEEWIREIVRTRGVPVRLAEYAARSVLAVPERRASGLLPDDPQRRPFTWSGIDAHEILFLQAAYDGGYPGHDDATLLELMGEFAAFLGKLGLIPPTDHNHLQRTWSMWAQQLLAQWKRSAA